ncbi:hypothetical protein [Kitasatospora atroaurantiaca]|nr:hypothetical protein [Kitasatospora atroaurantiaca]
MSGSEIARVLLEVAGMGFGLYAATWIVLLMAAVVLRHRRRGARTKPGPSSPSGTGATAVRRGARW